MKKLLLIPLLLSGCAYNRQYATVTETDTDGTTITRTARSTTYAVGDTKSAVDKTRASAGGKSASVGAAGLEQETTSTNFNNALGAIRDIVHDLPH